MQQVMKRTCKIPGSIFCVSVLYNFVKPVVHHRNRDGEELTASSDTIAGPGIKTPGAVIISAVKVDILGLRELAVHNTVVAINLVWG